MGLFQSWGVASGLIAAIAFAPAVQAASVPASFFQPGGQITGFDSPGADGNFTGVSSYEENGNVFTSNDLRRHRSTIYCRTDACLLSGSDQGFVNAALGSPVAAAGAYVTGFIGNWTVSADFFSVANVLLGTVNVSGANTNYVFVGFSGEGIDIGRVQFRDVTNNGGNMGIDDFLTNNILAVPEPATWAMMLVGFGMIGATARYRRRATKIAHA